jgi:predicted transposase YdaD
VSKPFDATVKDLLEAYPADWPECFGLPRPTSVEVVDADLSTVTPEADKVLRINGSVSSLFHLEWQTTYDPELSLRVLRCNVLLRHRHGLPVYSAVVLLRPEADGPGMSGSVQHRHADGTCYLEFRYQVLRVWQRPVESFLTGGLGTLAFAPISAVTRDELPSVVRRMQERLDKEATPAKADMLWSGTLILMGLRYPEELAKHLLAGVRGMKESTTYQAILREGKELGLTEGVAVGMTKGRSEGIAEGTTQEARRMLLLVGSEKLGAPGGDRLVAIEAITDVKRLEELIRLVLHVSSWEELFGEPKPKRRNGKPKRKNS